MSSVLNAGRILAEELGPEFETRSSRARKITDAALAPEVLARSQSTAHSEDSSPALAGLTTLPKEIVQKIADYLPPESVTKFAATNRKMLATLAPQFERAARVAWKSPMAEAAIAAHAEAMRVNARESEEDMLMKMSLRRRNERA